MQRAVPEKKQSERNSVHGRERNSVHGSERMNSVHGLERNEHDIAQLENYFGHECEEGVKVLLEFFKIYLAFPAAL